MNCPRCRSTHSNKTGFFRRKLSKSYSQRYVCSDCGKKFSDSTFSNTYYQKKPMINSILFQLLCSSTSFRRSAKILNVSFFTVYSRFLWMANLADSAHSEFLKYYVPLSEFYLDEMESIEHTKLKPLTIPLLLDREQNILGVSCGRIPAKGHLAEISRKKYGVRSNDSTFLVQKMLASLPDSIKPVLMKSDGKQSYRNLVSRRWPGLRHEMHIRKPDKQKELLFLSYEKKKFDPMFALNQRCAKLRDDIKRLARKNWCTTKRPENLAKHLLIYACYNNQVSII